MIGTVTTPTILREYGIEDRVSFYVDNDRDKCNEGIVAYEKAYDVFRVEHLESVDGRNIVVLLAVSRFSDALSQLNKFPNLKNAMCYIVPMMCISNFTPSKEKMVVKDSSEKLIPKVIHYMWLGGKPLPESLQNCVDSWKKYCPDYEIIRWDESNYDYTKNSRENTTTKANSNGVTKKSSSESTTQKIKSGNDEPTQKPAQTKKVPENNKKQSTPENQ